MRTLTRPSLQTLTLPVCLLTTLALLTASTGCTKEADTDSAGDAAPAPAPVDDAGGTDAGLADAGDPEPAPLAGMPLPQGDFLASILINAFGLDLPYVFEIRDRMLTLRAVDKQTGGLSDPLSTIDDAYQNADGSFELAFGTLTLPAAYLPLPADQEVDLTLTGQISETDFWCGTVSGEIITLSTSLQDSTFGVVPWTGDPAEALTSCSGGLEPIPRIEACPDIEAGENTISSGGSERSYEVVLPTSYDADKSYPLVFVFHGFGGNPTNILDPYNRGFADSEDAILVAPLGRTEGERTSWNTFLPADVNEDVTLFDDLLTCMSEAFQIDTDRVYATGHSFGGLMTGTLIATRGDKLAAAAPLSGGFALPYATETARPPVLVQHGGPEDLSNSQDFNLLGMEMAAKLAEEGHWVGICDHGQAHDQTQEMWQTAFTFLFDHVRGDDTRYGDSLPDGYPDYCVVQPAPEPTEEP